MVEEGTIYEMLPGMTLYVHLVGSAWFITQFYIRNYWKQTFPLWLLIRQQPMV